MAQLSRGYTFHDGGTGNSANLHALVDSGTILPGAIGEQAAAAPADADTLLFRQSSTSTLKKCSITQLKATIPANAAANVASLRRLGTSATHAAAGNDPRLQAPITGIRVGNGTAPDTAAVAADLTLPVVDLRSGGATKEIDWSRGRVFYDSLTANRTYTFGAAVLNGQSIELIIKKNGHTVTLPAAIGTVTIGTGTTFLHVYLTNTPLGTTGLQIAI